MFHKKEPDINTFAVDGGHWAFFENSKDKTFEYIDEFIRC